jgi:hypothetical protein
MDMTVEECRNIWNSANYKHELLREDALDCFHSIITLVERCFVKNDIKFASWMRVNIEYLRSKFNITNLLENLIVIQEYIKEKSYMNEGAFISIHETIQTICKLSIY